MLPCLFSIHPRTQNRLIHPWACSGLHPILLQLYEVAKASERPKQQVPELISHLNHSLNLTCPTGPPPRTSLASPKIPIPSCSPGSGGHGGPQGLMRDLPESNPRPRGMEF